MKFSSSSRKQKKNTLARHLGLAILNIT